jgi:hypothetical protein
VGTGFAISMRAKQKSYRVLFLFEQLSESCAPIDDASLECCEAQTIFLAKAS